MGPLLASVVLQKGRLSEGARRCSQARLRSFNLHVNAGGGETMYREDGTQGFLEERILDGSLSSLPAAHLEEVNHSSASAVWKDLDTANAWLVLTRARRSVPERILLGRIGLGLRLDHIIKETTGRTTQCNREHEAPHGGLAAPEL